MYKSLLIFQQLIISKDVMDKFEKEELKKIVKIVGFSG